MLAVPCTTLTLVMLTAAQISPRRIQTPSPPHTEVSKVVACNSKFSCRPVSGLQSPFVRICNTLCGYYCLETSWRICVKISEVGLQKNQLGRLHPGKDD